MHEPTFPKVALPLLMVRGAFAGVLMGLANLVPGISGGTMLLAAGMYPRFIAAIAEFTTFRFRPASMAAFGSIACAAALAILLLAGVVKNLVVDHRWIMYSLFIGLTLGGVPVVWKMIRGLTPGVLAGAVVGFVGMAALALLQGSGAGAEGATGGMDRSSFLFMFVAGIAGASAMILPGVSGGYLLLVLGVYVPILAGVDAFKEALKAMDVAAAMEPAMQVVLPVGLGVVTGVVAVSHLLKWVLARFERVTLGVLLGLLVGAVVGLWPFQEGVTPQVGTVIKGEVMTAETVAALDKEDYPTTYFTPTTGQVAGSIALIAAGFVVTLVVARLGREKDATTSPAEAKCE